MALLQIPGQKQVQQLAPNVLMGIRLLAKSLPELRSEIAEEISRNPALEDIDHPLEKPLSSVERYSDETSDEHEYVAEDQTSVGFSRDESAAERRQAFFDNQVREETLQGHLLAQLPLSGIESADCPLAEELIGALDEGGYFRGSIPDLRMAYGCSEEKILDTLAEIRSFDPPGCGARDLRECLLSQLDSVEDPKLRSRVRELVDTQLDNLANGRVDAVEAALGVDHDGYLAALKALRSLEGRPGRRYPSERERVEYVNPEIHSRRSEGRWVAEVDERGLPEIKVSKKFIALLDDPKQSEETKAYVRERIAAARAFADAVRRRQETVRAIANEIFSRQQDFFERGFGALKPMTESEIAEAVKVHVATVSRTVRDKYAETPKGTVELRRFFTTGVKTASGVELSQDAALDALRRIIDGEDKSAPWSDSALVGKMKDAGFPVARRTIAKYRDKLSIPGASDRRA